MNRVLDCRALFGVRFFLGAMNRAPTLGDGVPGGTARSKR